MLVMKFGGTSMNEEKRIAKAADIIIDIKKKRDKPIVVVASAMSQITNMLLQALQEAHSGNKFYQTTLKTISERHQKTAEKLLPNKEEKKQVLEEINQLMQDIEMSCQGIYALRELSPRSIDKVSSMGERLSTRLLAGYLRFLGYKSKAVDASDLIVTDNVANNASPLMKKTGLQTRQKLLPYLKKNGIPVVTGFMGANEEGVITTLGRGGSDYTASILAYALAAEEVLIWTDVDGILTADPRIVPDAHPIKELSYQEAAELAHFGAKVIHPKTIGPAVEKGIPVFIKNSFNPNHPGTKITHQVKHSSAVSAMSSYDKLTLLTIEGFGIISRQQMISKIFAALDEAEITVLVTIQSSSVNSLSFVIKQSDTKVAKRAIESTFKAVITSGELKHISEKKVGLLAVVGDEMKGTPGVAATIFSTLAKTNINILAIAQGSAENNITIIVEQKSLKPGIQAIHNTFHLEKNQ